MCAAGCGSRQFAAWGSLLFIVESGSSSDVPNVEFAEQLWMQAGGDTCCRCSQLLQGRNARQQQRLVISRFGMVSNKCIGHSSNGFATA